MTDLPAVHPEPADRAVVPRFSRRALIGAGGAAVVGMAVAGTARAADTVPTYRLDPQIDPACVGSGCSSCNACLSHAANKLFATLVAAEAGRAHPGCLCVAVSGMSVAQTVFDKLFAAADVADRRTPAIGALLASTPATVSAPGLGGWLPGAVAVGGVVTIGLIAAHRRPVCDEG